MNTRKYNLEATASSSISKPDLVPTAEQSYSHTVDVDELVEELENTKDIVRDAKKNLEPNSFQDNETHKEKRAILVLLLVACVLALAVALGIGLKQQNDEDDPALDSSLPPMGGTAEFPYMGEAPTSNHSIAMAWNPPGGNRFAEYKDGSSPYAITREIQQKSDELARQRRGFIKAAMEFAWHGYTQYAFGMDELLPISRQGINSWGNMSLTLVDSLDTLWLMGMKTEFDQARDWIRDHLHYHDKTQPVSVFETTIRSLGGLLSAYDWSGDAIFLDLALDLAKRLFPAFDDNNHNETFPNGLPFGQVNLATGEVSNLFMIPGYILAHVGTLQLEFRWLDIFVNSTETAEMRQRVEHIIELLHENSPVNGLFPYYINTENVSSPFLSFSGRVSFGAMADSFYEYLLKVWIQGGKVEPMYREMYDKAIQGMHNELLQVSEVFGLTFIAEKVGDELDLAQQQFVCFMGALLALGAYTDPLGLDSFRAQRDLKTARALAYTCYQTFARMSTGLAPDSVRFDKGGDLTIGSGASEYLQRPETIESLYVLHHLTGDPIYREWGWEIFLSIEKYCKSGVAYGTFKNVSNATEVPNDKMESFFLAETLKYLFLLFDPDTKVDLEKYVFNTEAHPIRVFATLKEEGRRLGVNE